MRGFKKFVFYQQLDQMDCGPTCLRMIANYYGKHYSLQTLRDLAHISKTGVTINDLSDAATSIGFRTHGVKVTFDQLDNEVPLPCIIHWNQSHFVVIPPQNYNQFKKQSKIQIADPAIGLVNVTKESFLASWLPKGKMQGIALILEPGLEFYEQEGEKQKSVGFSFLFQYLRPYKRSVWQLMLGMVLSSALSLVAPFLTQSMVDFGISQQNPEFVYLILLSQLALFFGNTAIEFIRSWTILHMSTRINITILSDFLIKLMKLPIRFFDTKMVGDLTQRISDHNRIENFLTGTSLSTVFSLLNLTVFAIVLALYSIPILFVFVLGATLSVGWILFFMKKRRDIDYARFQGMSDNQNNIFEIITGMQEIKMNNSESTHLWGWERTQARLFQFSIRGLTLSQYQNIGSSFFSQLKNIVISFLSAQAVISGDLTLGMLLSISYITGQMNAPIGQLLSFIQNAQDARISMERLGEIHSIANEESENQIVPELETLSTSNESKGLILNKVSFQYGKANSKFVLNDISVNIPLGKITAIVGASGSGKTTLMKILLRFYEPTSGEIYLNALPLKSVSHKWWRSICGVVMTDGFIFSKSIAQNISVHDDVDKERLISVAKLTNINDFVNDLPSGFATKVGIAGTGISSGQQQRILIARALYKDPKFLFLDEATNKLDANNEKSIIEKLSKFASGRTVIVIAHRLSTVKFADQIIVMENGSIVEIGTHENLTEKRGKYYELVRNQLELER